MTLKEIFQAARTEVDGGTEFICWALAQVQVENPHEGDEQFKQAHQIIMVGLDHHHTFSAWLRQHLHHDHDLAFKDRRFQLARLAWLDKIISELP